MSAEEPPVDDVDVTDVSGAAVAPPPPFSSPSSYSAPPPPRAPRVPRAPRAPARALLLAQRAHPIPPAWRPCPLPRAAQEGRNATKLDDELELKLQHASRLMTPVGGNRYQDAADLFSTLTRDV